LVGPHPFCAMKKSATARSTPQKSIIEMAR
jgi:hypothetical protein